MCVTFSKGSIKAATKPRMVKAGVRSRSAGNLHDPESVAEDGGVSWTTRIHGLEPVMSSAPFVDLEARHPDESQ